MMQLKSIGRKNPPKDINYEHVAAWYLSYLMQHHYAPTVREVATFCGVKSASTGHAIVHELVARGLIRGVRAG